jgi:predicted  nucleic acid-binding Zn-ribbon protein
MSLDQLLEVQEHDTTVRQLEHRLETLREQKALNECEAAIKATGADLEVARAERLEIATGVSRLDKEVESLQGRVQEVEQLLHSGAIAAPKELKALPDEIASHQRRQRMLEDDELELMERAEPLDAGIAELEEREEQLEERALELTAELAEATATIDSELTTTRAARADLAGSLPDDLLATYDRLCDQLAGVAVARLTGGTCGGCHLGLSAVEVDRIKKQPADAIINCEECGRILVR